jgi:hypothetical protein
MDLVKSIWTSNVRASNSSTRISSKFKLLRAILKKWSKKLSNFSRLIKICNNNLEVLDSPEEHRPLFIQEYNFRRILKAHILRLDGYKIEY